MDPKDLEFEETLADSELLLKNTARSMDEDAEFTLESILAEYGSGTPAAPEPEEKEPEPPAEKKPPAKVVPLPKKAEAAKKTVDETADETARIPVIPFPGAKKAEEPVEAEPEETPEEEPAQDDEPKSMSLQDVLAQTVQEALSEREDTIIEEEPPRRGLFSRRKMRDTEQLYDDAEEEEDEEEDEHHHHHEDEDEDHCCCGHHHHHHDDEDEDEEEHHHHHEGDEDEDHGCCGHHHHHHHADEVFRSWGVQTGKKFEKEHLEACLEFLADEKKYGTVLRAKGVVAAADGGFFHFDYVPGTSDIRRGSAAPVGMLCVIGKDLKDEALNALFGV